jgi:hypothetical protein
MHLCVCSAPELRGLEVETLQIDLLDRQNEGQPLTEAMSLNEMRQAKAIRVYQ